MLKELLFQRESFEDTWTRWGRIPFAYLLNQRFPGESCELQARASRRDRRLARHFGAPTVDDIHPALPIMRHIPDLP